MYAVYHGPDGLKAIAETAHNHARDPRRHPARPPAWTCCTPASSTPSPSACPARPPGSSPPPRPGASTCAASTRTPLASPRMKPRRRQSSPRVARRLWCRSGGGRGGRGFALDAAVERSSEYLQHPVFNTHRSETQLLRYIRKLSDRDLALDRTMIPLGSCTMKLNATAEMEAISWPEFASIHPFAPDSQTEGWRELIADLEAAADRDHRLRPGVHPAQRRLPGRARRPAGHPRLPPLPRRRSSATSA